MNVDVVLIILLCYLIGIICIGLLTKKKSQTTDGFFLANRSIGWKSLTATITATTIGGSATIVAGGRIYSLGLPGLWYDIGGAIGLIVLGLFLAKKIRKTSRVTLPDITGSLYDGNVRFASAVLILITEIAWIALLIQSSSMILSTIFPIDYIAILLITSIIFISYTLLGGQYAVVYTDIIQFLIMVIGICILAAPLLLLEALPYLDTLPSSHLQFPVNQNLPFLSITSIFFMMFLPHVVGPDIYSKILSSKTTNHARLGTILAGLFKILFAFSIGVIALAATVLPSVQESITNPYQAIPLAISTVHPIIAGMLLATFLATMMSTADSCLLSAGTILSVDIIKNNKVITSQLGILIIGVFALLLAIYYSLLGTILDTLQLAYTVFTAGLTVPVLFGFYKEKTKATAKGALVSLILGGGSSLIFLQIESISAYAVLIGLLVSVVPLMVFRNGTEKK